MGWVCNLILRLCRRPWQGRGYAQPLLPPTRACWRLLLRRRRDHRTPQAAAVRIAAPSCALDAHKVQHKSVGNIICLSRACPNPSRLVHGLSLVRACSSTSCIPTLAHSLWQHVKPSLQACVYSGTLRQPCDDDPPVLAEHAGSASCDEGCSCDHRAGGVTSSGPRAAGPGADAPSPPSVSHPATRPAANDAANGVEINASAELASTVWVRAVPSMPFCYPPRMIHIKESGWNQCAAHAR